MIRTNSAGQPISAAFIAALQSGFKIATLCQVWSTGATPTLLATTPLSTASVVVDRDRQQRRSLKATIEATVASGLIPTATTSSLAPFGNELKVFFGVTYADLSTEMAPMGVFPFTTTDVDDDGKSVIVTVAGYDRSWVISGLKFKTPYAVAAGTDLATAIRSLINTVAGTVYPNLTAQSNIVPTTGITTPAANFKEGDDPWAAALTLADACGYQLFFDANGVLVGQPIPTPSQQSTAWSFAEGTTVPLPSPNTVPETLKHSYTRDGVSNDFIVSGTGTGNTTSGPVRASASDTTTGSPTNVATMGDFPQFITSTLVTSSTAAQNGANNALAASKAKAEMLTVKAQPNPLLDIDDVVGCTRTRLGLVASTWVVVRVTHAVRHDDSMELIGRRVT